MRVYVSAVVLVSCLMAACFLVFERACLIEFVVDHSIAIWRARITTIEAIVFVPAVIFFVIGVWYLAYDGIKYNYSEKRSTIGKAATVSIVFLVLTMGMHQNWHNGLSQKNFDFKEVSEFEVKPVVNQPTRKRLVFVHEETPYEIEVDREFAARTKVYLAFYQSGRIFGLVAEKD